MMRDGPEELQTEQEILDRAAALVARTQGRTVGESVELLRFCAAVQGLSLPALALAVLSSEPSDQPLLISPARTAPRHLSVRQADHEATTSVGVVEPVGRGGRHRAR